jgi:hypothetical protein
MSKVRLQSMLDAVELAMAGIGLGYREAAELTDERRETLLDAVREIKARDRQELIAAIGKAMGG